ncbi:helix-turn-helix transcriptional regulator [Cohnella lupini]|uniref:Putative ArsR family transcriptional regulator n=1 Tax=Cohnella lupini TaxID=1294267 RepID=A0A3D9IXR6_9BACL|nr:metalloregulator ArsR/SmtB family transcription factor [Cohnella lupini]RED66309.1 putative ArsR family transcriptional regulator [Cohnella lupini]
MKDDMDLSTRNKIMQMLKTSGELTTKELTDQLGITGMAVRRHISILERDNLIVSTTVRLPMGRPAAVYRLTDQAEDYFPKKYHAVALDLLAELEGEAGENMVNHLFDLRKTTLMQRYESKMANKDLEHKVAVLSDIQNENGYMATWEKSGDEFVLTEHNCPISRVANKYNHACNCELNLFESLLDAQVSRTDCLANGDKKCVYRIRPQ